MKDVDKKIGNDFIYFQYKEMITYILATIQ